MQILGKILGNLVMCILFVIAFTAQGQTAPLINNVSGTFVQGASVTVNGSGFGTKNPAKPLVYADFASSISPNSTLGQKSTWDNLQNLTRVTGSACPGGSGECIASVPWACGSDTPWALAVDYASYGTPGQTSYVYKKHRLNFSITAGSNQNWKIWRIWPALAGYPNCHFSTNTSTFVCESTGDELLALSRHNMTTESPYHGFTQPANQWFVEEILFKASHSMTQDGEIIYAQDGVVQFDKPIATLGTVNNSLFQRMYPVHDVIANCGTWSPAWNATNQSWHDDVYVDTTWSRVMICAGSTWASRGHCEIQIPSAWSTLSSTSSATITVERGTFGVSQSAYLYVVDSTNTANATGFRVTFGSGTSSGDTTPPAGPGQHPAQ